MNIITKASLVLHMVRWRATWDKRNTRYPSPVPENPKFMTPREAVALIHDGAVLGISGLAGNQRPSVVYWAIQELFEETGHPCDLTIMAIGGIGGRSKLPGTAEELGREKLAKRLVTGHMETFKTFLKLGDAGKVELQCIPQGVMAFLLDAQTRGEDTIRLRTGVGTFIDPRVGRGSPLTDGTAEQWVHVDGDTLHYRIPKLEVALFNAPAADREGNIYVKNAAMIGESRVMARAARKNGGKVIVNVGLVVDKGYDEIFLPAEDVDAIVAYPETEQTGSVKHRKYWSLFTTDSTVSVQEGIERVRFINSLLGITPKRSAVDSAMARLAASLLAQNVSKGAYVNIGTGLPEEVCRVMYEGSLLEDITLLTESGVMGGVPTPGVFFGAAVCPRRMMSSTEIFNLCYEKLDVTCLGVLQADSHGNVNVSKRGEGAINYVGPGGFIDLTTAAKMVVFISTWMAKASFAIRDGKIVIERPGPCKFVEQVDEITFNGQEALRTGKRVFYATNVGAFQLTERGMELIAVMPGIDIQKDIVDVAPMRVVLPPSGEVLSVDPAIVTGDGFNLTLRR